VDLNNDLDSPGHSFPVSSYSTSVSGMPTPKKVPKIPERITITQARDFAVTNSSDSSTQSSYTQRNIQKYNVTKEFPQMESNADFNNMLLNVCSSCASIVTEWWSSRADSQLVSVSDFKGEIKKLAYNKKQKSLCTNCSSKTNCPKILQSMSQFKGVKGPHNSSFFLIKRKS